MKPRSSGIRTLSLREATDTIRNDLIQVIENPAGTAHEAHLDGVTLAGKTGTAEIKASQEDTSGTELGWFNALLRIRTVQSSFW